MIAKGTQHDNGARLGTYLTKSKDGEIAELYQLRGFASEDIKEAFRSVHVMADATKAKQPFFHVQVRLPDGETLTPEQWEHCAGRIERTLKLNDQPRAIAFHIDRETGDQHMHVAWSRIRIDGEKLTAVPLPFYAERLKRICRSLEREFGITRVKNERDSKIGYAPTRNEDEQARRLGVDVHQIRETVRACYDHCDCGRAFQAALAEEGLILAQGDRRDYLVVDASGGFLALGKKLLDVSAAQVRSRLADLDRAQLPTLEQAREQMLARELAEVQTQIEAAHQAMPDPFGGCSKDHWKRELEEIDRILYGGFSKEHWKQQLSEIDELLSRHNWDRDHANAAWEEAIINAAIEHDRQEPAADPKIDLVRFRMDADYRRQCEARAAQQIEQEQQRSAQAARYAASIEEARCDFEEMRRLADAELGKTAAAIRLAYNLVDSPVAFKEVLEQDGLTAARVTREAIAERESAKKQEDRDTAIRGWDAAKPELLDPDRNLTPAAGTERPSPSRRLSDYAREGDVVILDKWGNIYELNQRTIGDTRKDAQAVLAGIGHLPSIDGARRELEEKRRRPIHLSTGPQHGGLVAQQMWALRRVGDTEQQRREQQRREEERRARENDTRKPADQVDPHRYLTDPDYRREIRTTKAYKTPEERKADRENELRALLEQQDRQRR